MRWLPVLRSPSSVAPVRRGTTARGGLRRVDSTAEGGAGNGAGTAWVGLRQTGVKGVCALTPRTCPVLRIHSHCCGLFECVYLFLPVQAPFPAQLHRESWEFFSRSRSANPEGCQTVAGGCRGAGGPRPPGNDASEVLHPARGARRGAAEPARTEVQPGSFTLARLERRFPNRLIASALVIRVLSLRSPP